MGIKISAGRDAVVEAGGDIVGGDRIDLGLGPVRERLAVLRRSGQVETADEVEGLLDKAEATTDDWQRRKFLDQAIEVATKLGPALIPLLADVLRRVG